MDQQRWLTATYPDARLFLDLKHSTSRARETKWPGNYRYALIHGWARDHDDMMARLQTCEHLDFDAKPRETNNPMAKTAKIFQPLRSQHHPALLCAVDSAAPGPESIPRFSDRTVGRCGHTWRLGVPASTHRQRTQRCTPPTFATKKSMASSRGDCR